jgi:hypothetical protein
MTAKIAAPVIRAKISHKVMALFYRTVDAVIRYLQRRRRQITAHRLLR